MKFRACLLTVTSLAFAQGAHAQDRAEPFTGPSVTAITGYEHPPYTDAGGVLYGGVVGYDAAIGRGRLGVEAEATGSTADECLQVGAATQGCTQRGRDLYVGGRAGVVVGPVLLYGKVGYTNLREHYEVKGPLPVGYPSSSFSFTQDGYRVGAGAETAIGRFLLRAEYRYSDYGRGSDLHQVVAGVGVRF